MRSPSLSREGSAPVMPLSLTSVMPSLSESASVSLGMPSPSESLSPQRFIVQTPRGPHSLLRVHSTQRLAATSQIGVAPLQSLLRKHSRHIGNAAPSQTPPAHMEPAGSEVAEQVRPTH